MSHRDSPSSSPSWATERQGEPNIFTKHTERLVGAIARPESDPSGDLFEITSGIELLVDWDDLETDLYLGILSTKDEMQARVGELLGDRMSRVCYKQVIAGLMPEYRDFYEALPGRVDFPKCAPEEHGGAGTLDENKVREIRARYAAGERQASLVEAYGVNQSAISKVVTFKTWKDVA